MSYIKDYFDQASSISLSIDQAALERLAQELIQLKKQNGRLFFIGVGGSAANCSHAVNDFRKIAGIEAYAPTDNVAELTARTNDEGWETVFESWLKTSHAGKNDALFVLSVGGGSLEKKISVNIVRAVDEAKKSGLKIFGIVGPDGGHTFKHGDVVIRIPVKNESVTPHTEAFQAVVWHCLVCHPGLANQKGKWEQVIAAR